MTDGPAQRYRSAARELWAQQVREMEENVRGEQEDGELQLTPDEAVAREAPDEQRNVPRPVAVLAREQEPAQVEALRGLGHGAELTRRGKSMSLR